jgi:CheY-like chemotaxis protein/HPt (histidine-containing phosphotransfer) domain-containing protein
LGGTLEATSAPGAGTRFVLRVPAAVVVPESTDAADARTGIRVLLVEDNEVNRMVTEGLLRHAGFAVTTATTTAEAVRASEAAAFDAVVVDLRLPDGDGVALTRRLRERFPTMPLVALTAYVGEEEEAAARRAGVSAYLKKPTGLEILDATLRRLVQADDAEPPLPPDRVDRERLAGHFKVLGEGTLRTIVRAFDRASERTLAAARAWQAGADTAGLDDALHALRGAAGQLGLEGIAQRAAALELAARDDDRRRLELETAAFAQDLRVARAALAATVDDLVRSAARATGV